MTIAYLSQQFKYAVKEQRVNGSYLGKKFTLITRPKLRCILINYESSYRLKIQFKQMLYNRNFYNLTSKISSSLEEEHPQYIKAAPALNP